MGDAETLQPVLEVGFLGGTVDLCKPPVTAQEYIKQVVVEASSFEDVAVASVDRSNFELKRTPAFESIPNCTDSPAHVLPNDEWQLEQVANFSAVRRLLAQRRTLKMPEITNKLPERSNEKAWYTQCVGSIDNTGGIQPLVSTILSLSQPTVEKILEYNVRWLQRSLYLPNQQGRWLYALLAALEMPIAPDTCFNLRTLARECARIRAEKGKNDASEEEFVPLNLFISLVTLYFQQVDLADV